MDKHLVFTKAKAFALRIMKMSNFLQGKNEYIISKQILRSGTAIGALIAEAIYAQSDADYINKLSISRKEGAETLYWLDLLLEAGLIDKESHKSMFSDCDEIMKLLTSIIKTMRKKL